MLNIEELLSDIISRVSIETGKDLSFEIRNHRDGVYSEVYKIDTIEKSKMYNKEIGEYEIYSIPSPMDLYGSIRDEISGILSSSISRLLGKITNRSRVLVVGLGNRHISSDSLGARVCGRIGITIDNKTLPKVMAICPSVLGLTGIETYDIISGVIDKVKPSHLIIIDSLCASAIERLATSIQLSNTGLCPGSGIGNNRKCIDRSVCKNIVSIGVPLLIFARTFIRDTFIKHNIDLEGIMSIMQNSKNIPNYESFLEFITNIENVYNDDIDGVIVSNKDIDEMVSIPSGIISNAINKSLGVAELIDD